MLSEFTPQGQLEVTSFPVLIRQIHGGQLSGNLTLTQGQVRKVIQFSNGQVMGTASNLPQDSVLSLLVSKGQLTPEQAEGIKQQAASGKPLGQTIAESGLLPRETLAGMQVEQVTGIFLSLCEWTSGSYQFTPGQTAAQAGLTAIDLLLNSIRRTTDNGRFMRLLGGAGTLLQLAPGAMERCAKYTLQPQEGFLITRLDMPITLGELLQISGLPEDQTLRGLYALECAGLIVRAAARASTLSTAPPSTATTNAPRRAGNPGTPVPIGSVFDTPPPVAPAPPRPATPPPAPPASPSPVAPKPPATSSGLATQEEIIEMARLTAESHDDYKILGLTQAATRAEVKAAYSKMAKKYHPDRYLKQVDEGTISAMKDIVARVRKAYEKLKDVEPTVTAAPTPPPPPPQPSYQSPQEPPRPATPPTSYQSPQEPPRPATPPPHPSSYQSTQAQTAPPRQSPPPPAMPQDSTYRRETPFPRQTETPFGAKSQTSTAPASPAPPPGISTNANDPGSSPAPPPGFSTNADELSAAAAAQPAASATPSVSQPAAPGTAEPAATAEPIVNEEDAPPVCPEQATRQAAEVNFQYAVTRYKEGDMAAAIELMGSAVEMAPENAFYRDQLATLLAINPRRRKEAEAHLLKAIELEPKKAEWQFHLGLLYKNLGMSARADTQFKKALALDPQNEEIKNEIRVLKKARQDEEAGQAAVDNNLKSDAPQNPGTDKPPAKNSGSLLDKAKDINVGALFNKFFKRK
ncbi:MAG: DUF4388 domain-containing protein [Blastocatellia bacterium]